MIKNFNQPNSQISFCACIGDFGTWAIKLDQKATQQELESPKLLVHNKALQQSFSTKTVVSSTYGSLSNCRNKFPHARNKLAQSTVRNETVVLIKQDSSLSTQAIWILKTQYSSGSGAVKLPARYFTI